MEVTQTAIENTLDNQSTQTNPQSKAAKGPALRRAMVYTTTAWMFGSIWFATINGTPTTNYAKTLGASPFEFGVLAALPYVASLISLPASIIIEATGKRKRIFLT